MPTNRVIYVDNTKNGNGSSWANACNSLADALKYAHDRFNLNPWGAREVDSILVTSGTYYPNYIAGNGTSDRDKSFVLVPGLTLIGGFNSATGKRLDNPSATWGGLTVLSGDIGIAGDRSDNVYHVVVGVNLQQQFRAMDGFVIKDGNANGSGGSNQIDNEIIPRDNGGGIILKGGYMDAMFKNIVICNNSASANGGGIANHTARMQLLNVAVYGNAANNGGGVYCPYESYFTNVTITGNKATTYGGGLWLVNSSYQYFKNSILSGNIAGQGRANIYRDGGSTSVNFSDCILEGSGAPNNWAWGDINGLNTVGNLDVNPMFVSSISASAAPTEEGNYHILNASPAKNVGSNDYYTKSWDYNTAFFIGWDNEKDASGNTRLNESIIDIGAYEYALLSTYKVAFLIAPNDTFAQQDVEQGGTATSLSIDSIGFNFLGWYISDNGIIGDAFDFHTTITKNITLQAKFSVKTFNVKFLDYATNAILSPIQTVSYNSGVNIPIVNVQTGYKMQGWFNGNTTQAIEWNFDNNKIKTDTTLYAKFVKDTATVHFIDNNKHIQMLSVAFGDKIPTSIIPPVRTGYTFVGWFDTANVQWNFLDDTISVANIPNLLLYSQFVIDTFNVKIVRVNGDTINVKTIYGTLPQFSIKDSVGYYVSKLYTLAPSAVEWVSNTTVSQDTIIYVEWTPNKYTLVLSANSGILATSETSRTVTYNTAIGDLPNATKQGFDFLKWNTKPDGNGDNYVSQQIYNKTKNDTIYAIFKLSVYKVYLDFNGGNIDDNVVDSVYINYDSVFVFDKIITRTGHYFIDWSTDQNGSETTFISNVTTYPYFNNSKLYAQWEKDTFTVVIIKNSSVLQNDTQYIAYLEEVQTPDFDSAGYTSIYFCDAAFTVVWNWDSAIVANTTIYTKWNPIGDTIYFSSNGGTWTTTGSGIKYPAENLELAYRAVTFDQPIGKFPKANKTGQYFVGWNRNKDATISTPSGWVTADTIYKTVRTAGDPYDTLYIVWNISQYRLVLNANGGTVDPDRDTIFTHYDSIVNLPVPTWYGHIFKNWNSAANGSGIKFTADSNFHYLYERNISPIYAQWILDTFNVTFINETDTTYQRVPYGNVANIPNVFKQGYSLLYWYSNVGNPIQWTNSATITSDTILYAEWNVNEYELYFDYDNTVNINSYNFVNGNNGKYVTFGNAVGDMPYPSKKGFTFEGWNTCNPNEITAVNCKFITADSIWKISTNDTVYAEFSHNLYNVILYRNDGTPDSSIIPIYYDSILSLPQLNREKYTFLEWNTNNHGFGNRIDSDSVFKQENDIKLYAQWKQNPYIVTVVSNKNGNIQQIVEPNKMAIMPTFDSIGYCLKFYSDNKFLTEWNWSNNIVCDTTIYVQWIPITYSLYFGFNGGQTGSVTSKLVVFDQPVGSLPNSTRVGWSLQNWNTCANITSSADCKSIKSSTIWKTPANDTVYAQWQIVDYFLKLDYNGLNIDPTNIVAHYDSVVVLPTPPNREGYTFVEWNTNSSGQGTGYSVGDMLFSFNSGMILYAIWNSNSYVLTLDANGGTISTQKSFAIEYGDTLSFLPIAVKNNAYFSCWNTKMDGSGINMNKDSLYNFGKSMTFYAVWGKIVMNANDNGEGSLRNAMNFANAHYGGDILFNTDTAVKWLDSTIYLQSSLPNIKTPMHIKGHGTTINCKNISTPVLSVNAKTNITTIRFTQSNESLITNNDTLFVMNCIFDRNHSTNKAGSILNNNYLECVSNSFILNTTQLPHNVEKSSKSIGQISTIPVSILTANYFYGNLSGGADSSIIDGVSISKGYNVYDEDNRFPQTNLDKIYSSSILVDSNDLVPTIAGRSELRIVIPSKITSYTTTDFYGNIRRKDTTIAGAVLAPYSVVTFIPNNGESSTIVKLENGQSIENIIPTITKQGYNFIGWTLTNDDTAVLWNNTTKINNDITLYAKWRNKQFVVQFKSITDSSTLVVSQTVNYFDNVALPAPPTKNGYKFDAWYQYNQASQTYIKWDFSYNKIIENITLYGQFVLDSAIVYFISDDVPIAQHKYAFGSKVDYVAPPLRKGYSFDAWYYVDTALVSRKWNFATDTVNFTDIPSFGLFAMWIPDTMNVFIVKHIGDTIKQKVIYNTAAIMQNLTYTGYYLFDWTVYNNGSTVSWNWNTKITKDTIINAVWTPNQYTLYFDANGGTVAKNQTQKTVTFNSGIGVLPSASKLHSNFVGWNTQQNANGATYTDNQIYTKVGNDTIYAVYQLTNYTITLNVNGGNDNLSTNTLQINYDSVFKFSEIPTRTGYTFLYWQDKLSGYANTFENGITHYTFDNDITLYAQWIKDTFNVQIFGKQETIVRVAFMETVNIPDIDSLGYTARFYSDNTFSNYWDFNTPITQDTALYAKWTAVTNTAYFFTNGGHWNGSYNQFVYDDDTIAHKNFTYNNPFGNMPPVERLGYTLMGWNAADDASSKWITPDSIIDYVGIDTFYAIWKVITIDVIFHNKFAKDSILKIDYAEGGTLITLYEPNQYGYTFIGWKNDTISVDNYLVNSTENVDLYAVWDTNKYLVDIVLKNGDTVKQYIKYLQTAQEIDTVLTGYYLSSWTNTDGITWLWNTLITQDTTVVAQWQPLQYKLYFDKTGGEFVNDNALSTDGEYHYKNILYNSVIGNMPAVSRTGFTFVNWADNTSVIKTTTSIYNKAKDDTLYAEWSLNTYKIILNYKCPEVVIDTIYVHYDSIVNLPTPTWKDHTFIGWNTLPTGKGDFYQSGFKYAIDNDIILYAFCKQDSVKVSIYIDNDSIVYENIPKGTNAFYPIYDKIGYSAMYYSKVNETYVVWDWNSAIETDTILYAQWTPNSYKIFFVANGGYFPNQDSVKTVIYDQKIGSMPMAVRDSYDLQQWKFKDNTNVDFDIIWKKTNNDTAFATWLYVFVADTIINDTVVVPPDTLTPDTLVVKPCLNGVVMRYWNNIIAVNNNSATNGGYEFENFQWYKDSVLLEGEIYQYINIYNYQVKSGVYEVKLYSQSDTNMSCPIKILPSESDNIIVYPNPAKDIINVKLELSNEQYENIENKIIEIYDIMGHLKLKYHINSINSINSINIDVSMLPEGMYILKYGNLSKKIEIKN
ncbi:hypothetical protein FACS1894153_1740 [Bacteroidia bacterium]|nr:hypothetical protein FACS1894153_1740 [Bacteroidia bacterium]